ncbi:restriction endonuclease [Rhodococcus sp. 05-339-2]|uniref:DEAD/DEAH box helicase family protein n=1 Tax=Rhodococcoides fascians TaxID=1828 RepID=UPI00050C54C2|nr:MULTISPECIES: DEAD/DEAH box helicase family protein [Rhodococcus]OZD82141.1 restriction endonuclease [Rhodococcus sp. 05-339-2]
MNKPTVEEILAPKPHERLRVYAWTPNDPPTDYAGLIKIGQTTQPDVNARIKQSQGQMQQAYTLHVDEPAERWDGTVFRDGHVRQRLIDKGFENVKIGSSREWMRCTPANVKAAVVELQRGLRLTGAHHDTFEMREEQKRAVAQTIDYFRSRWDENANAVPRFLWNAKMRFGKTFGSYQLAKQLGARKVLVVTFKPAVEDAWRTDLESHVDFQGWQYASKASGIDITQLDQTMPIVYFGSFQDLLGKDEAGSIKSKNQWVHTTVWDFVIFDEYHFGAWRDTAKELFEGEDDSIVTKAMKVEYTDGLAEVNSDLDYDMEEENFLPIKTRAYLYLSGTPFKALASGDFIEEQIFNWTYTDEQRASAEFSASKSGEWNPYGALPQMRLLTYKMPEEILAVASAGEFDEFDLNEFFTAEGIGAAAEFKYKDEVQKWLNIIRGQHSVQIESDLKKGTKPPFPYSDVRLLPYLNHSLWSLPRRSSCDAMANLLAEKHNTFWHDYTVVNLCAPNVGVGLDALPPVRSAIAGGFDTKTITLTVGKLTTGVTIPQWSSILMLRNLKSPESYFQTAFRVQSPWAIKNPNGDNPNEELVWKPVCYVFDFAPTRALRQLSTYAIGLSPYESNPEKAVAELISFLPVLAYDGSHMTQIDAGGVLDIAMAGTSATLLARKWESAVLVNVDNVTLRKVLDSPEAMAAVERIEGFRALGDNIIETIISKAEKIKGLKQKDAHGVLSSHEKKELSEEEREYKQKRKLVQEKLIKFATRIPAFMYLTDFRENSLKDVITQLEPDLFRTVTGLTVGDFDLLVSLNVFNSAHMNDAVFNFRRYEDASLAYTGIDSHEGLTRYGLYDTVVAIEGEPTP